MAKKVSNFTDLVQRVTASCLLHPLGSSRFLEAQMTPDRFGNNKQFKPKPKLKDEIEDDDDDEQEFDDSSSIEEEEDQESGEIYEDAIGREIEDIEKYKCSGSNWGEERENEAWMLMSQVFDSVSAVKKAYGKLQEAHSPWDPEKMRTADEEVVAELRRLAVLRERFRRSGRKGVGVGVGVGPVAAAETVREVVAPYEAAVEELKKEVKVKEVEVEELREKVKYLSSVENGGGRKNGRSLSRKKGNNFIPSQGMYAKIRLIGHKLLYIHFWID